ncbi:SRPBCC family protein [Rhodococcus opacus]|nr:SRPBCC family protein [Rhodococcus opacus]
MSITEIIDVAVPVCEAYTQWTKFESFPRFMEGVERVEQVDATHLDWTVKVGLTSRRFRAAITTREPDRCLAWRSETGPHHAGTITFEPLGDTHTRVTAEIDIDPDTFTEWVTDRAGVLNHRVKDDMKRFKDVVERPVQGSPWSPR